VGWNKSASILPMCYIALLLVAELWQVRHAGLHCAHPSRTKRGTGLGFFCCCCF
jgi:hypothetical protein